MSESDVTLGELGRRLDSIASDISSIRAEAVMRGEYETRLAAIDREIRDLKDANTRAKQPWTSVVNTIATVANFALVILLLVFALK